MEDRMESSSFKRKIKSMCGGCFRQLAPPHHHQNRHHYPLRPLSSEESTATATTTTTATPFHHRHNNDSKPILRRSSSVGLRSDDLKHKCRHLISRMGHQRKSHSTDFRYDPLSYSLNFDQNDDDQIPLRNFTARLPSSPAPLSSLAAVPPPSSSPPLQITAYIIRL
ncbi:hypothetical protein Cgig2_016866 [Carnegiea gigantea]|uniref:Uncharacterized protein n=1 Tax=Carnegiea gigantea TaxID=171969 RepID=A0A9Q1K5G6_9CARY|nr:hypothetical protein Cgig2_016866 [Carnegiea gigantea]